MVTFIGIVAMSLFPAIPQPANYHEFVDTRSFLGIRNFFDVISNIPIIIVGIVGLWYAWNKKQSIKDRPLAAIYFTLFLSIFLTGIGSAWYHLNPSNDSIIWDRMPLTVVFMSFFSMIIAQRINTKAGIVTLVPLSLIGIGSVIYWYFTELAGRGDLRAYALVQYYPVILIPLILFLFPSRHPRIADIGWIFFWYTAAKFGEVFDRQIYAIGNIVSGHTLKHIFASVALYWMYKMIKNQMKTETVNIT